MCVFVVAEDCEFILADSKSMILINSDERLREAMTMWRMNIFPLKAAML